MAIELPEILDIPPKLYPIITEFDKYKYIILEGGRGSAKTQSVARLLLHIAELRQIRIICGREVMNTIEESVYTVLSDLIRDNKLAFRNTKSRITHLLTNATFNFKGFREQGKVNIKGVEGADVIWIDEAQTVTKGTLGIIIPTIRKNNCKLIFTMNRYMRDDAVINELSGRDDCLHIKINYYDNPKCPLTLKNEAEILKNKSEREYRHIWLGEPLASADDYLFNYAKLHESMERESFGDLFRRQRVLAIDFAAQGNDQCVASILDRVSNQHWQLSERIAWDEPDTMISTGKIVNLIGTFKPDLTVLDVGGMGKPVYDRLIEVGMQIQAFDGGSTEGVDTDHYGNIRAAAYYTLKEWFDQGFIIIRPQDSEVVRQLEKVKMIYRSNGVRFIEPKLKMKKELGYSPDDADSLNMAVWGAVTYLGKLANTESAGGRITRKSGRRRNP